MKLSHLFFIALLAWAIPSPAQNGDINLLRKINQPVNIGLDKSMRVVSGSVAPLMIAVPVGILIYNYTQTRSFTEKKEPYVIAAALIGTTAITFGLKYAVNRSRPFVTYPDIIQKDSHVGPYSFPSGHTSSAFALATSLSLCYQKWYVAVPAYLWAITVGYSRMRLGVHFPTDVLAGALIGTACSVATWYISHRLAANTR
ncbi:MAG TPA: phosphatase PAP2 family protein [Bacteroidia bacterium]|nr:phosphatase PAP2 family protein [Bacteroidia bacterium]